MCADCAGIALVQCIGQLVAGCMTVIATTMSFSPVGNTVGAVTSVTGQVKQLLVEETSVRVAVTITRWNRGPAYTINRACPTHKLTTNGEPAQHCCVAISTDATNTAGR